MPRPLAAVLSLCLSTALAAPASRAAAQRPGRPVLDQTFALNPLALPFGFASAEYEHTLGRGGFALGVGGLTSLGDDTGSHLDRGEAYRTLQAKLKYYPREDGLRGFAVGVTAGVAYGRSRTYSSYIYSDDVGTTVVSGPDTYATRTAPTLGATLDYNFFIGRQRRFLVGLGVGAKRTFGSIPGPVPLDRVLLDPRLQIGFGF